MTLPARDSAGEGRMRHGRAGNIFAFANASVNGRFESDLSEPFKEILGRMHAAGYGLMPLNPSAIGMAESIGLPYHLMEDWLEDAAIIRSKELAETIEREWYRPAEPGFRSDGILWPLFDDDAMYWFWRDVTYADAFVRSFVRHGGQRLAYFMNASLRPALYYYDSDINGAYWQAMLGQNAQPFTLDLQPNLDGFNPRAIRFDATPGTTPPQPLAALNGRIVLALNQGEIHRFQPVIQQLKTAFPDGVAMVIIHPAASSVVASAEEFQLPVVVPRSVVSQDEPLASRFLQAYGSLVERSGGKPWGRTLNSLGFHFHYYCKCRWPALASSFRAWLDLWEHHRPAAVVVSSLRDAESQLPCEAAKRFDVPTLSIPHGGSWMKTGRPGPSDYVLYQNTFQKIRGLREGIPPQRMIPCREMLQLNEYPVTRFDAYGDDEPWHVLALTNEVSIGKTLSPRTVIRAQLQALRALADVPEDIAPRLSLRVKAHPHYPDLDLYPPVSDELAGKVLPPNSELGVVIRDTHLVVAVNYSYVAAFHALRAGRPVLFFWTDPLIFGRAEPQKNADLLLPGGTLIRTAADLWSTVRRFFTDTAFAEGLRRKARQFVREAEKESPYHTIADVMGRILSTRA